MDMSVGTLFFEPTNILIVITSAMTQFIRAVFVEQPLALPGLLKTHSKTTRGSETFYVTYAKTN